MRALRSSRLGLVLLAAAAGSLAHVLGYYVPFADAHEALHRTGHDYLGVFAVPLAIAAVIGLIAAFGRGFKGRGVIDARTAFRFLALVQSATFIVSELLERGLTGELLTVETLVAWASGLTLEVLFAAVAALLYRASAVAGRAVASALRRRRVACVSVIAPRKTRTFALASRRVRAASPPRAPPAPALA